MAMASTSEYYSARIQEMSDHRSEYSSELEFRTAFAKCHWTEVTEPADQSRRLPADEDNINPELQKIKEMCREWSLSLLVHGISLGEKIGGGGQADVYEALYFRNSGCLLAAKVFKESLNPLDLQLQCPAHIFQFEGDCKYIIRVLAGAIVDDGRFAFLTLQYPADLRKIIDDNMRANKGEGPPFPAIQAFRYMLQIACGMRMLHSKDTLHRDLKASNILVWLQKDEDSGQEHNYCAVADYECSLRVKGTAFWRAPEVLQALKDGHEPEFTNKVDVYSYAMTCYEILTGSIPFEDRMMQSDYDFVIDGNRPNLPVDLNLPVRELLRQCWHAVPDERPEFSEIVTRMASIMVQELQVPEEAVEMLIKPKPNYQYT